MEKAKGAVALVAINIRCGRGGRPHLLGGFRVSKDQSSKWQQMAKLPAEEFERRLGEGKRSATSIIADDADVAPTGTISDEAYGLYGHLTHIADVYLGNSRSSRSP